MKDAITDRLRRWVLKSGVNLGGLAAADRDLALVLCAAALPPGEHGEAQVNAALKAWLAGAACWIECDHVELRRWLVDRGLWQRDGFGRAYRRAAPDQLDEGLRSLVDALAPFDLPTWVPAQREQAASQRAQRRQAWQARGTSGADGP